MPGVIDSNWDIGACREVGKMAFFGEILSLGPEDVSDLEDLANHILNTPNIKGSPRDSGDSEGELPDEATVDLLGFLENENDECSDLSRALLCDAGCTQCNNRKKPRYKVSKNDPFMSSVNLNKTVDTSGSANLSMLGQIISPLDENHPAPQQESFNAWSHTSNSDEYHVFTKSSFSTLYQEEEAEEFPETPSTTDQNVTDDSDVDIETVTDLPHTSELRPSPSRSSSPSPLSSPCTSPLPNSQSLQKGSLKSILSRSTPASPTSSIKTSLLRYNSYGVSSSASLAENLMAGRSHSIQKRKFQKERKLAIKTSLSSCSDSSASSSPVSLSPASHQATYSHVLVNSNSVNFHDYALSPGSCTAPSTETARPTVLKRMYRKRQFSSLDITDKEKQHHHNQLERNRRQKLADLFTDLRDEIPKIKSHSKASKVVILNDATDYIHELQILEQHQDSERDSLMQRQRMLKEQLRRLQASYSLLS